eukprot:Trichotokara_eunicae@DN2697_c0_g1_i1.p1
MYSDLAKYGYVPPPKLQFGPGVDTETDYSRWEIIYPSYLDAKKKLSEGRRICQKKAVDAPTVAELGEICAFLKVPFIIEDKTYPRDILVRGRLRVELKESKKEMPNLPSGID